MASFIKAPQNATTAASGTNKSTHGRRAAGESVILRTHIVKECLGRGRAKAISNWV
jgi:hypothetical protein